MFAVFYKYKFLTAVIFIFLFLSIICQIIMGVLYQNMIKEADNMPTTKNKLLKQCKLKFINAYKLNGKMCNTSVFVDKFLSKIEWMGISLTRLTHLSGQLMMLSVVVTGISVCLSLAAGDTLFQIIPYYLLSILGLYLYFSVSGIVDISRKREQLKTNLVDYLENHLMPRMEAEETARKEAVPAEVEKVPVQAAGERRIRVVQKQDTLVGVDFNEELEDLLKEFFA